MSAFGCCIWWLLLGALLGWLLNYLLCKSCKSKNNATNNHLTPPPSPPASKEVLAPVATAPVMKAASPLPAAAKPKAAPAKKKPAAAKPKPSPAKNIPIDVAAAKTAGFKIKNADDLTVIEGIGPKINDLFKENGLNTFTDVASSNATKMRAILDKGGARFRIANPSTWAKQAKLASTNKWKELKKLQDDLSGGIEK